MSALVRFVGGRASAMLSIFTTTTRPRALTGSPVNGGDELCPNRGTQMPQMHDQQMPQPQDRDITHPCDRPAAGLGQHEQDAQPGSDHGCPRAGERDLPAVLHAPAPPAARSAPGICGRVPASH
jgi:hypothetical protein